MRLLLLLWADPHGVPGRTIQADVFVMDAGNQARAIRAGIALDIDAFERRLRAAILKGHVAHTIALPRGGRRDGADAQPHAQEDTERFDVHVLRAGAIDAIA